VRAGTGTSLSRADDDLCGYAERPFAFIARYAGGARETHIAIVAAVVGAVGCSISAQYGVKFLIDTVARGPAAESEVWTAFALLVALITGDNLLWRLAGWIASYAFVRVTGDLRVDLFPPSYRTRAELLSPIACREFWRVASPPPRMRSSPWKACSYGMCCRPAWRRPDRSSSCRR